MRQPMAVWSAVLVFALLRAAAVYSMSTNGSSILYYTDGSNITRVELDSNVSSAVTVITTTTSPPYSIDCNSCDSKLYWASQIDRTINRGTPTLNDNEVIVSIDIVKPVGVAVDWRSNNVYYTDDRGYGKGRVEVVTCDGRYRRVLVTDIKRVGPLAVDVLRGYMYWVDESTIMKAWLDGTNPTELINLHPSLPTDITVDYTHERLYWAVDDQLARSDLNGSAIEHNLLNVRASAVSVSNDVLFWLDNKGVIQSHLFPLADNTSVLPSLPQPSEPGDITSFMQIPVTGGCSTNNGNCEMLCFTIPSSSLTHSMAIRCGCPTGLLLNGDGTSCSTDPVKFLLFIQHEGEPGNVHRSSIMRISLDSQQQLERIPMPLDIAISAEARAVTYSTVHHKVYWTEVHPPRIMRANSNGAEREEVVTSSLFAPEGIAVDYHGGILYWADSKLNRIEAISLRDGQPRYRRVIVETSNSGMVRHPRGLALDESLGRLIWSDFRNDALEQYHFNSSQRTTLVNNGLKLPGPVAVRPSDGGIYGADSLEGGRIFYYNGNSAVQKVTTSDLSSAVQGLAFIENNLYWSESTAVMMELDITIAEGLHGVTGLVAIDTNAMVYDSCLFKNGGCDEFCVVIGITEHVCACRDHYHVTQTTQCTPDHMPMLFMSANATVYMWRATSTGWPVGVPDWVTLPIAATAMDYDSHSRTLYWISANDGYIYRAMIDDTNVTALTSVPVVTCCYDTISDIAIDWWGRNIYWTDKGRGLIGVAKLDGTGQQVLAEGLGQPDRLVINPYKSVIYYTSQADVRSVAMDGNVTTPTTIWSNSSIFPIQGMVFDTKDKFLFWSHTNCVYEYRTESIGATPIYCDSNHPVRDSNTVPSLLTYYNDNLFILIPTDSPEHQHVYREDEHMPNQGGNAFFIVLQITAYDIIIADSSLQPDAHLCTVENGECMPSNEAICLISSDSRECRCPPTMYLQSCTNICTNPDTFLLFSTSDTIYHLPINVTSNCPSPPVVPRPLPLGVVTNVMGVAYDPVIKGVVWIEGGSNGSVATAQLNGSKHRVLTTYHNIFPLSLAYDSNGGHVFWTNTSGTQIELVAYNGGQGVMLNQHSTPVPPSVRLPIAMDTNSRTLYYGDPISRTINKLHVDTGIVSSVSRPRSAALLLAVDDNALCWYEESLQAVQLCHDGLTSTVANGSLQQFTLLSMVSTSSGPVIFWFNQSSNSLYQYSAGSAHIIATVPNMVTGISAHHKSDDDNILHACASKNRMCSHLCNPDNNKCSCSKFRELSDNMTTCLPTNCPSGLHACSDGSSCIPATHLCDRTRDCLDGSDELNCECNDLTEFYCYNSNSSATKCVANGLKCNNKDDCASGEDESYCHCATIKCVTWNGVNLCLPEIWINDGMEDCMNGADEQGSSTHAIVPTVTAAISTIITIPTTTSTVPSQSSEETVVITTSTVLAFSVLVVAIVLFVICQCILSRRYKQATSIHNDHPSSIKTSSSPQIHSEFSNYSINTSLHSEETRSTTIPIDSTDMYMKQRKPALPFSNPPNSPITPRRSILMGDNHSFDQDSELLFECPRPPNPSINPSVFSDNISSVSQRRYTSAVLPYNNSYHHRVAPAYHHQPHLLQQQQHYHTQPSHLHYTHQYQPTTTHIVPSLVQESDNLSESSYNSQQTRDFADTSFIDVDDQSTAECQYCDSAPPPSLVTDLQDLEDDFT